MLSTLIELLAALPNTAALRIEGERAVAEIAALKQRNEILEAENAHHRAKEKFTQHRGVLWRASTITDDWEETPYCPNCRLTMFNLETFLPFECGQCNVKTPFPGSDVAKVRAQLPLL